MVSARRARTQTRRRNILDAALALFLERGVSETTADDIRARSGASVGSLYHHFSGGKEDVAAALYLETIAEYQAGFLAELRRHRQAATGVRATVRYHLRWVETHRDAARFLFNYGDLELRSPIDDDLAQLNARLVTEVRNWSTDVGAEELTNLPVDAATAIWIGPAQQFARRWLAGGTTTSIDRAARLLAAGASAALSGGDQGSPNRRSTECGGKKEMERIGVVDTMFARIDMGAIAQRKLATMDGHGRRFQVLRRTVPGMKDLAVAAKQLIEGHACSVVIACGMPGPAEIDQICAHEASQGIMLAQVLTGVHILEVFVHVGEEPDESRFMQLCRRRVEGHALNAYWLVCAPEELAARAGRGIRQGADDAGPLPAEAI